MSLDGGQQSDDEGALVDSLSPRERQLLEMATNGHTDQAIANDLGISLATVSTYWGRIRIKYGPHGRTEIVARYLRALMNRASAELQVSESRFRTVLESSPVGAILTDAEGTILYGNPAFDRIAGQDLQSLVRTGLYTLIHSEDRERVVATWEGCLREGTPYMSEHRYVRPDGSVVWVRSRGDSWHEGEDVRGRVSLIEDITLEHEAREAEERYGLLFAFTPVAIVSVNENLAVVTLNGSAERTFGYTADESVGLPLQTLIPDTLGSGVQKYIQAFGGGSQEGVLPLPDRPEARGRRKDGTDFPCEISMVRQVSKGKPVYTAIVREVAERATTEGRGEGLDGIPLAAWRLDKDGEIVEFNEALLEATGRVAEKLSGKDLGGLIHSDDLERYAEALRRATEDRSKSDVKLRLRCDPDGADRWQIARILSQTNRGWLVVCTDVHELEVAADELRRVKAVLGNL